MDNENRKPRPPIVVVMGHVDHGKTTLLDYIRKTNVAGGEKGGITQSIGAYEITHQSQIDADLAQTNADKVPRESAPGQRKPAPSEGRRITFIDTPGHEAFVKMRSAGAEVADLAILVVAAEEGLKPQTKETLKILEETKTPFVIAINKIDKPEANIEKIKNELAAAGVLLEGYGGQTSYHSISAKTGEGVGELLDLVILASDLENHTYNPQVPASGFILETRMASRRGLEAIVILKDGVLKAGDKIFTPSARGKIKILENFLEERVDFLLPSAPAVIIGFETMPRVGEKFTVGSAPQATSERAAARTGVQSQPQEAKTKELFKMILKAEDSGSLEALSAVVKNLKSDKSIAILNESIGDVSDGDVKLATASGAIIIGFKTKISQAAKTLAAAHDVKIVTSAVIYELVKTIEELIKGSFEEKSTGELEVLAIFNQEKLGKQVVGGKVIGGTIKNKAAFEIKRARAVVGQGKIISLQQQKKDTNQVSQGNECGLLANAETAIQVGDMLASK